MTEKEKRKKEQANRNIDTIIIRDMKNKGINEDEKSEEEETIIKVAIT
jgi:hypothetical protein